MFTGETRDKKDKNIMIPSLNTIKVASCQLVLMQFISFSNIMILYIFLDVDNIPENVREILESLAEMTFGNLIISGVYNLIQG